MFATCNNFVLSLSMRCMEFVCSMWFGSGVIWDIDTEGAKWARSTSRIRDCVGIVCGDSCDVPMMSISAKDHADGCVIAHENSRQQYAKSRLGATAVLLKDIFVK